MATDVVPDDPVFQTTATFRALANSLPLSLLIKSPDGRRVFANTAYLKWRNKTWEVLAGKTDEEIFPPEVAKKFRHDDQEVLRTAQPQHSIEESRDASGEARWIECVKSPILDPHGRMLGIQILFWDVTDRIAAELAMRYEQSLLKTLLDNIPDSIYFKDLESRFIRVSHAMAVKFGRHGTEEILGRTDADIFTTQHAAPARQDELEIIRTGVPLVDRIEKETWRDREDTWCLTTKMPLRDDRGEIIGTFGISRDITDLKRSEVALRDAVRMADAANRAKSEFLANMSHEIRTPMNAIVGMGDLLVRTDLTEEQRDCVSVMRDSADALLRIINDILDFSKIEARRLELEAVPFSLTRIVSGAIGTLRLKATQKNLRLSSHISSEIPPHLVGDAGRLRQVLVNLIGNAIKFTDVGTVSVSIVPVGSAKEASPGEIKICFRVTDTGIGIPESQQASVLDPFTQADASTTRRFGGTGLGLSISRQLVDLMGGELKIESQVGRGTTFSFELSLPVTDDSLKDTLDDDEDDLIAGLETEHRLRVLVAEDGITNQHVISGLLRSIGHECAIASDGRETLMKWKRETYDLILMDMHMPVMDGLEATRAIRQDELGTSRHIPIIALTAAAMPEDARDCREAGMDDYLTKPIHVRKLRQALSKYTVVQNDLELTMTDQSTSTTEEGVSDRLVASKEPKPTPSGTSSSDSLHLPHSLAGCLDLDSARSRIPGGAAGVRRLAAVFRLECEDLVKQLERQIPAGDQDAARRTAHTLKGACGLLGARELQSVVGAIEAAGLAGTLPFAVDDPDASRSLLTALQSQSAKVMEAIDELLGDNP